MYVILHRRANEPNWHLWNETIWHRRTDVEADVEYIRSLPGARGEILVIGSIEVLQVPPPPVTEKGETNE